MLKRRSKHFALLLVLTMLATMFVGVGTASAKSLNTVNKVISIADDYDSTTAAAPLTGVTLTIKESTDYMSDFANSEIFELELPSGVKWVAAQTTVLVNGAAATTNYRTDQILEVQLPAAGISANNTVDTVTVTPGIKIDGFAGGDVAVKINPLDSAMTAGSVVIATVGTGTASVTVSKVEKISKGTGQLAGTLAIRENSVGAIGTAAGNTLTFKLPGNYEWPANFGTVAGDITFGGGLAGAAGVTANTCADRTATLTFSTVGAAGGARGTIYVRPRFNVLNDAAKGEISINVTGTKASGTTICDTDIVAAEYIDWGTTAEVTEVKELKSGRYGVETAKIKIKENMAGSLLSNRTLNIKVADWVKITDITNWTSTGDINGTTRQRPNGKNSYVDIVVNDTAATAAGKGNLEFKLELSIQADKSGDIEATISGAGASEQKVVIAKAVQSAKIEGTAKDLKVGIQSQELADIIITEGKKEGANLGVFTTQSTAGSATRRNDGAIVVNLTEGVEWSATPKVEVIEGNLEIKDVSVATNLLTIPVKSESTSPSKIKISGAKVTLDRSVPEGPIYAKLQGSAINENQKAGYGFSQGATAAVATAGAAGTTTSVDAGEFDLATVQKTQIGTVVTAAPGEINKTAAFVIGQASFKLNGVDTTMDVAPYIKDSRTYMPIRYVANALGIADANILWDGTAGSGTVTLMKGDKVVQLKIGSKTIMINGAAVTMDVAPEITNARTMLPISFVANAFGATASWDAATQTVTIK